MGNRNEQRFYRRGNMSGQSTYKKILRTSLVVQWLRLHIPTAEDAVSILGWENKDPTCCVAGKKKLTIILILNQINFLKSFSLYIFLFLCYYRALYLIFSFKQYLRSFLLQLVLLIS